MFYLFLGVSGGEGGKGGCSDGSVDIMSIILAMVERLFFPRQEGFAGLMTTKRLRIC